MAKAKRLLKIVEQQEQNITTWEDALKDFLLFKKAEGKSERTIKDYCYHIRYFFKQFPDILMSDPKTLRKNVIQYMSVDSSPAHYNNKLVYLKTFFNWCVNENILGENPLNGFNRRKAPERIVQMDVELLKKLLAMPDQTTFSGLRDYALLLLQLDTGIRPKEALSLLVSDINLHACEVYIRAENAKTRIARTLPISPVTAKAIQKLISVRPKGDWPENVPVFCNCEGKKMLGNGWYKRISQYGKTLGATIYPYQLRHTFALEFLRNGGNSFALQKTMGHADMNMTKRYVSLADSDIKQQHLHASPVSKIIPQTKKIRQI